MRQDKIIIKLGKNNPSTLKLDCDKRLIHTTALIWYRHVSYVSFQFR